MSNFNVNNPPGGPYNNQTNIVSWLVVGVQTLWRRVNGVSSSGGGSATNNLIPLFDHYTSVGNVGTDETDLYSDTIVANTLATNGDKLEFMYSGTFDTSTTKRLKVYIGINVLLDSTAVNQDTGYWTVSGTIIRKSISVIRSTVKCDMYANAGLLTSGSSYSFTLETNTDSDTDNILKITGQAGGDGAGDNDIIATMGTVTWISHA